MPMTPLPPLDRTSATFRTDVDALFLTRLPAFTTEANTLEANMTSIAAGGAYSLLYTFDSTTTDADPGVGKLRLSSATQNTSTTVRLDTTVGGVDVSTLLDGFDASTSTIKGSIRLVKMGDVSKWLTFDVTARAAPTGYRNITVTNTGGSSASPFANGDGVMLFFQRNGDKGLQGDVGLPAAFTFLSSATVGAAVANIDFLSVFSAAYDKYVIELGGVKASAADTLNLRLAKAGAADSAAVYVALSVVSASAVSVNALSWPTSSSTDGSFTVEIRNVNDAVRIKGVGVRGAWNTTSSAVVAHEGFYNSANVATGFRLYWNGGSNFTSGTVRVYGVKNS